MLPWLQRRWRTGQLGSIDGGGWQSSLRFRRTQQGRQAAAMRAVPAITVATFLVLNRLDDQCARALLSQHHGMPRNGVIFVSC